MEGQSYKIYFNEGALVIADSPEALRGLGNLYFIGDDELQKSFKILLSSQNNGKPLHFGLICPDPNHSGVYGRLHSDTGCRGIGF
jgi:hypothetical protein